MPVGMRRDPLLEIGISLEKVIERVRNDIFVGGTNKFRIAVHGTRQGSSRRNVSFTRRGFGFGDSINGISKAPCTRLLKHR